MVPFRVPFPPALAANTEVKAVFPVAGRYHTVVLLSLGDDETCGIGWGDNMKGK